MFVTLMYHLVEDRIVHAMSVPLQSFRTHLAILDELHVRLLTLGDIDSILDGTHTIPRGVLVTFDDGYTNSVETVLPILEERSVPAVISLCASYLRIETRPTKTIHPTQDFASIVDIEAWLATGREIAGHSYSHPRLTDLPDDEIVAQIVQDKVFLENTFARSVDTFVYPFGAVDKRVEQVVGRHYRNGFSDSGGYWPRPGCRLAMHRLKVRPDWSPLEFRSQVETSLASCLGNDEKHLLSGGVSPCAL